MYAHRINRVATAFAVAVAAGAAAPVAGAAPAALPNVHAHRGAAKLAHPGGRLAQKALSTAHRIHTTVARSASVSTAWNGASATCVGTAMSISMGRNFGEPLGAQFAWRSRLLIYNPSTRTQSFTPYGPWMYDQMPNPSGYITLSDGTYFVMGPSGGILPTFSPTAVWTSNGAWVYPYVQVYGWGERPVNITGVAGTGRYSDPNWCYIDY